MQVDLGGGEQFGEAFRKINADCVVPVLELDDGTCISEVLAICSYLEELHHEPNLMGTNAAERAYVLMWNTKIEQQGFMAIADAVRNVAERLKNRAVTGPKPYAQIPQLAERGRKRAAQCFQRLDVQLANSAFVAGDSYSIADISALVVTDFATRVKISLPDDAENLQRWYESGAVRPSASA